MKYVITIPEPCSENWHAMTQTEKGKFCDSCQKEVVDFTQMSTMGLSQKIKKGAKLCGRFRPEQLNRNIRANNSGPLKYTGVLVAAVALLAGAPTLVAQAPAPEIAVVGRIAVTQQTPPPATKKEMVKVKGVVRNGLGVLSGASIWVSGTEIKTHANAEGKFELLIPAKAIKPYAMLYVSSSGYEPEIIKVYKNTEWLAIELIQEQMILGEVMIEEHPNLMDKGKKLIKGKHNEN